MLAAIHDPAAVGLFITAGGFGFTALVVGLYLAFEINQPVDEVDEECSRIDADLDARRAEGSVRRWTGSGWRN